MNDVDLLSPLDGRYRDRIKSLASIFSERGLYRARAEAEIRYLIALSENSQIPLRTLTRAEQDYLLSLVDIGWDDYMAIQNIEATTRHDVKALEYFLKEKLTEHSAADCVEWIHFALTSEDVNNLAYSLMLERGMRREVLPTLQELVTNLTEFAREYQNVPMLARTHGQPATPTTFGKEMTVFVARLQRQYAKLDALELQVKFLGATGAWNAHRVAFPEVDWLQFTSDFIESFDETFELNYHVTQIEAHDSWVELFDGLRHVNTILTDFSQDIWRYISDGWIIQANQPGEVGSSTMPHKINPIQFENAEGNLVLANALLTAFSQKLPISRLQRDLSDSTVERNIGVALGYSLVAYKTLLGGLGRIRLNEDLLATVLNSHPEVVGEAIQTVLRAHDYHEPYEMLKAWTRGQDVSLTSLHEMIAGLDIDETLKEKLINITPANYLGYARELTAELTNNQQ